MTPSSRYVYMCVPLGHSNLDVLVYMCCIRVWRLEINLSCCSYSGDTKVVGRNVNGVVGVRQDRQRLLGCTLAHTQHLLR